MKELNRIDEEHIEDCRISQDAKEGMSKVEVHPVVEYQFGRVANVIQANDADV